MTSRALIVIFGEVRTLKECILSIYNHIILVNRPCHVVLAIDGKYEDIPSEVMQLLRPVIYDVYVTHNKEDDLRRDHQSIEFSIVEQALLRIPNVETSYDFVLKIRTDIFVRHAIDLRVLYGRCPTEKFSKAFTDFMEKAKIEWRTHPTTAIRAWFLTGGIPFFIPKQLDDGRPPISPWSTSNVHEWNASLFGKVQEIVERMQRKIDMAYMHFLVRRLAENERVVYLIGSTWIHFGLTKDIVPISYKLVKMHTTMTREGVDDEDVLTWVDHKGETRAKPQKEWRLITDDQMRMVHHVHGYHLMDLVNPTDYIESFDAVRTHQQNKKNPSMFAWIVRKQHLRSVKN